MKTISLSFYNRPEYTKKLMEVFALAQIDTQQTSTMNIA
jgi:hypothetical protein